MSRKFNLKIPKKPFLKRQTYDIPEKYLTAYKTAGIDNADEQIMLFHITQFGGFRVKKMPSDLELGPNFIDTWCKHKSESGYSHFKASPRFLHTFGGIEVEPLQRRWNLDALNQDDMEECGFTKQEIQDSYTFLDELNKFYSALKINLSSPRSGITAEDRVYLSGIHGRPFLVKKPHAGGRFFHPGFSYQRMSSSLRPLITINGERTCEFDLSAATLQFLNICFERETTESLQESILHNGDPYQYFLSELNNPNFLIEYEERPTERDDIKTIVYTMIFSPVNRQRSNVNRRLRLMGRNYDHPTLVSYFPEFFNALTALCNGKNVPLHMPIFREESRFTQAVLQKGCLEERLPILPLHDSFITTETNSKRLGEILDSVSEGLYGRRLTYKQKY